MIDVGQLDQIQKYVETTLAPAIGGHGGTIEILSFDGSHIELEIGGACAICAFDTQTIKWVKESLVENFSCIQSCDIKIAKPGLDLNIKEPVTSPINPLDIKVGST